MTPFSRPDMWLFDDYSSEDIRSPILETPVCFRDGIERLRLSYGLHKFGPPWGEKGGRYPEKLARWPGGYAADDDDEVWFVDVVLPNGSVIYDILLLKLLQIRNSHPYFTMLNGRIEKRGAAEAEVEAALRDVLDCHDQF